MNRNRPHLRLAATASAIALLLAAIPGVALAQTAASTSTEPEAATTRPLSFDTARNRVLRQIERRLDALQRLGGDISGSPHVTDAHATSLHGDITAATNALTSGILQVEAATSVDELRAIAEPLFGDTLVFALLSPKTHEVLGSDAAVAARNRFAAVAADLQEAIDRLTAQGADMSAAQDALDEMERLADEAVSSAGPVAATVIGLQPGDWPDPATRLLQEGRLTLTGARASLREARHQAHTVLRLIRRESTTG
jgi:hypothetical protein